MVVEGVIAWLVRPLQGVDIVVLTPTEAPIMYFQVALVVGLGLALPYMIYQVYAFMRPGLHPSERRIFLLVIPAVLLLFFCGAIFTVKVLITVSMPVLMNFLGELVRPTYSLEKYLHFVTTLILWMGLIFETPLIVYTIARLGWVTPRKLRQARRIVWFMAALGAAVVTPTTDPVTMLMVTGPFILLYELGLLLAHMAVRQRRHANI
jgi:sec-independent protein translocase protein TatC